MENFLVVQCVGATEHAAIEQTRTNTELSAQSTVNPHSSMGALRCLTRSLRPKRREEISGRHKQTASLPSAKPERHRTRRSIFQKTMPEMKDPSGGTTGRVKPYWRLGWMGARAEYSRWGGDYRSHIDKSQHLRRTFKTPTIFLTSCSGRLPEKPLRSRLFRGVCGRFVRRHRRRGVIQCPAHGSVIGRRVERRRFFSRRLA